MQKRDSGTTVTIKINGKKQSYDQPQQQGSISNDQPSNNPIKSNQKKETAIFNPLDSKIDLLNNNRDELDLPKMEDKPIDVGEGSSSHEVASAKASDDEDQFDWILPEPVEVDSNQNNGKGSFKTVKPFNTKPKKKTAKKPMFRKPRNNRVFTTIFAAVFLAVLLGTSFGLLMLKLVIVDNTDAEETSINQPIEGSNGDNQNGAETSAGKVSVNLPELSTYIIQGGVFSKKEAAKGIEDSVKESGGSAVTIANNGQYVLLLGVADTMDSARSIRASLEGAGVEESFPKEYTVGGKQLSGLSNGEKTFLEKIPSMFDKLTSVAASTVLSNTVPQSTLNEINELQKQLENSLSNKEINTVKEKVDQAIATTNGLTNSVTAQKLTTLQQQLLEILTAYHALSQ